ncbi:MAG: helix-turn-helix domain-containing protein, partial [Anaerolineales bacterium]
KYQLTYVTATRSPLDPHSELAELFFAHTLWLGPLSEADAHWNIERYAQRLGERWDRATSGKMIDISGRYPALLRAVCEAFAAGTKLDINDLAKHPAVKRRLSEFWADEPGENELSSSNLVGVPLLKVGRGPQGFDTTQLTAKEHLLLNYLRAHPEQVCDKHELVQAVWPEDQIYERGIRDDSLAQLVRRLRVKIEPNPSNPRYIHTVTGRGYRFTPESD